MGTIYSSYANIEQQTEKAGMIFKPLDVAILF